VSGEECAKDLGMNSEGIPLGRLRSRWEDNINMDIREIRWGAVYWIQLAQDRDQWLAVVTTLMNLRIPYNVGKCCLSNCSLLKKNFAALS
jgi:hypothetical protein